MKPLSPPYNSPSEGVHNDNRLMRLSRQAGPSPATTLKDTLDLGHRNRSTLSHRSAMIGGYWSRKKSFSIMSSAIYDISVPISCQLPCWPGDPSIQVEHPLDLKNGDPVTVSFLK